MAKGEEAQRLSKVMAARGVASRREAERWIEEGRVTVNGAVVRSNVPVSEADAVRVDGKALPEAPRKAYYLLYKPRGTITGREDPEGRKSVLDLVEHLAVRVEPVGRLDYETEGALLLTNDGELAHRLTHPSTAVPKRYRVKVYRRPSPEKLDSIREGKVYLDDGPVLPAKVRVVESTDSENTWLEITITEGRNRLIRRLFQQLRHPVAKLRRESFAGISIRGMERGQVRPLTGPEIDRLHDLAAGRKPEREGKVRYKKGFALPKPKVRPQARRRKLAAKAARTGHKPSPKR